MKKKKLTSRQRAVNRIYRRLNTLDQKGVHLKIKPTKQNIEETLKANNKKITKNNMNDIVNEFVEDAQSIKRQKAKEIKKLLGFKKLGDVQEMSGMEMHDTIKKLYDNNQDETADAIIEVLESYGY